MELTTVATVTVPASGPPLAGVLVILDLSPGSSERVGLTNAPDGYVALNGVEYPASGTVTLGGTAQYAQYPITISQPNTTLRFGPGASNPQDILLPAVVPFKSPFVPAPRTYKGCMGRIVPGVEFINGAYPQNPELVFAWLLHRYSPASQAAILQAFKAAGDEDYLLSWCDFDSQDPAAFGALIQSVQAAGFRPCVFLINKNGPTDLAGIQAAVAPVLPILKARGVPRVCVGWELTFLDPGDVTVTPPRIGVLQPLIDWLAPQVRAWGALCYVHFTEGTSSWQPNGLLFADFWNRNVHQLRGVLHQKVMTQTDAEYQTGEGGLRDILLHFNGGSGCTPDSGDGTPFDLVAFEVDLELLSEATITEAEMHRRASVGVATPPTSGPTGAVSVMGSGCGLA